MLQPIAHHHPGNFYFTQNSQNHSDSQLTIKEMMVSDQNWEELSMVMVIRKEEVERGRRIRIEKEVGGWKKRREDGKGGRRKEKMTEKNEEISQINAQRSIGANMP